MRNILLVLSALLYCDAASAQQTVGLFARTAASQDGYVLFAPQSSTTTYLMDKCGKSVHTWTNMRRPALSVYLLEDGSLLRTANANNSTFSAGGSGGMIQRLDWNSSVLWTHTISSTTECSHHDVCRLPNGNILAIVWEMKTSAEAIAAGRIPAQTGTTLWSEKIVELQPTGSSGATVVWEWKAWDHLVQEADAAKPNYATVSQHPELIHLNFNGGNPTSADWLHINSVAYNPALDQIMVSVHGFSELWVIDHSTTTTQAASHSGGARGKGGDLLYRWGNPQTYNRGTASDQKFFKQHNAHWIESGLPDAGKVMVFNNGLGRPGGAYSTVDVLTPAADASGNYTIGSTAAFGPASLHWQYIAATPADFYSSNISGAQRLSNGNTLICEGASGEFFEVDATGIVVWKYMNPVAMSGPLSQGTTPTQNSVFRCTQYAASYAGLAGKTLTPGAPIELNPLTYSCTMSSSTVDEVTSLSGISVTNPFRDALHLRSETRNEDVRVELINLAGAVCQRWSGLRFRAGEELSLEISRDLPPSLYSLRISSTQGVQTVKLSH